MTDPVDLDAGFGEEPPEDVASELAREFGDPEADDEDGAEGDVEETRKAKVKPAQPWPQFNISRAHAELRAMEMLIRGASYLRVRRATGLSPKNVRRLATIVAEEAASPADPRIVCRTPARCQPARIRVRQPADSAPTTQPTAPVEPDEPVQMALALDC
ncbi:hypothetical protein [Streptomyces sp. NBC_01601]|uniref:hypothetical protein n=1 Tax=Streptomyces sp. NBC_01601 TaxID=2975892 RepID=UPI002E2D6E5D|nr:hypothetical protein [Streptomyces sp. NBC_01601]